MRRLCPTCNRRVPVHPEKASPNATLPDASIVWAYTDHGCDMDGMPVTLPEKTEPPPEQPKPASPPTRKGWRASEVLALVRRGIQTADEMRLELGCTWRAVWGALRRLEERGAVKATGEQGSVRWTYLGPPRPTKPSGRKPRRRQVYLELLQRGPRTTRQLADAVGTTHHAADASLKRALARGLVRRELLGGRNVWRVA